MKNEFHDRRNQWSVFKGRSLITLVLVLSMIISVPFLSNAADEAPGSLKRFEEDQRGKLTVILPSGNEGSENEAGGNEGSENEGFVGLDKLDLTIDLYKIAFAKAIDGSDGYIFDWDSSCESLKEKYNELANPSVNTGELNADNWHELSQAAANLVLNVETGTARTDIGIKPFSGKSNPEDAAITIDQIDAGLYLLVVRGTNNEGKYVTKSKDDDTVTKAWNNNYSYIFLPQLVSLPRKGEGEVNRNGDWKYSGTTNTAGEGDWYYDLKVYLKPERANGKLRIVKTLYGYYANGEPATFVFQVVAKLGEDEVYNEVHTIDFSDPGTKYVDIEGIPVGAEVTVTEIYSGAHYSWTAEGGDIQTIKEILPAIAEDEVPKGNTVYFENDYDDRIAGGHGITNHFTYDAEKGSWDGEKIEEGKPVKNLIEED